ncbi:MAG: type II toxin-antitoxin system RelE/ParE family toxin [Synergistaceae bacterium]|nr:type II toxin-antitoxin system RelE/ParE family toxin [Synergistaceae bacterium]
MSWKVSYLPEADEDLERLDNSQRLLVLKAITKVSSNPKSKSDGGYGTPLGNRNAAKLADLFKIKLKKSGLRIVYKLVRTNDTMLVIIVGARADNIVYIEADKRLKKHLSL